LKFLIDNWMLFAMAATSGALLLWPMLQGGRGSGGIGTAEAVRLINREKGVLVDVGEPDEFAAGHAGGARNVPLGSLEGGKGLPTNKTLPLVLMCPSGARAAKAAEQLRKAGYEKAVSVAGGTAAWREASLPIEKSS
jgi:rhodanese-related sulfurtransferase